VSISPTFYEQFFHTKVFCNAFLYLQFGFVILWHNNIGAKTAHKMLTKLTTGWQGTSAWGTTTPTSASQVVTQGQLVSARVESEVLPGKQSSVNLREFVHLTLAFDL
jgi:hypothetical protein